MTQNEKILDIRDREGQITKLRAMHAGIMCLTSRIDELRKAGLDICDTCLDNIRMRAGWERFFLNKLKEEISDGEK